MEALDGNSTIKADSNSTEGVQEEPEIAPAEEVADGKEKLRRLRLRKF